MEPYLPNYLKGKNRRLVFDLLRERGQMSRAEITRDTGMSFPTAMKVVDAFLETPFEGGRHQRRLDMLNLPA